MAEKITGELDGTGLKTLVLDCVRRYQEIAGRDADETRERAARLAPLTSALTTGVFRLVVMGEIKKGKSSFISAFLGYPNLMPTDTGVATSVVYKIVHGPAEVYTVFFLPPEDSEAETPPLPIRRDQLNDFGTEKGNPGNVKRVDFIVIELPHPILKERIALVDTPGIGGLFKKHREVTYQYAPDADVVFFVLDSAESNIGADELLFLDDLRKNTRKIVFLQTKTDLVGGDQAQRLKQRNLEILQRHLKLEADQIPYFLVSSKVKFLADEDKSVEDLNASGFSRVLSYLRTDLMATRDAILTQRWVPRLATDITAAAKAVESRLIFAQETNKEKLAVFEKALRDAEEEFNKWHLDAWPAALKEHRNTVGGLKIQAESEMETALTLDSHVLKSVFEEVVSTCKKPEQVMGMSDAVRAEFANRCQRESRRILDEYKSAYLAAYDKLMGQTVQDLLNINPTDLNIKAAELRRQGLSIIDAVKNASMTSNALGQYAQMAAMTTAGSAGWLVVAGIVTAPVAGLALAGAGLGLVGTKIWATVKGYTMARAAQLDQALANLEAALSRTAGVAQRQARLALKRLVFELDSAAQDGMDGFQRRIKAKFASDKSDLQRAGTQSRDEAVQTVAALKLELQKYASILKTVLEAAPILDAKVG